MFSSPFPANRDDGSKILFGATAVLAADETGEVYRRFFAVFTDLLSHNFPSLSENGDKLVNGYRVVKQLGKGAFAVVQLCEHVQTGQQYAFKKMSKSALKKKREFSSSGGGPRMITALDKVRKEIELMKTLWHENIVPIIGVPCMQVVSSIELLACLFAGVIDDDEDDIMYIG